MTAEPQGAEVTIEFLITALIVVITPGTGALYTISTGLSRGTRASVIAAVGCTLGIVPHLVAAVTGMAALLNASAVAFQTLKYLGVVYLLYMAWATIRDRDAIAVQEETTERSALAIIARGVLVNILNPKLTLFFFAFLPQFVDTGRSTTLPQMLELSAVFMLMTFVVFAGYGAFAAAVRTHVISRPRVLTWLRRGFAAAFVALGVKLAVTSQN
ncbi:MAG TPA: LysE family translocator [Stackebrandtia sp.]|nr:LysE family translocator [Stackebrandtia sp.]HZE41116.1 LysE family translocator [Stackebrandtia sp.]